MNTFINTLSCIFDMFILKTYLDAMLNRFKGYIKPAYFYLTLLASELVLAINLRYLAAISSTESIFISSVISITTTMLLCLFYTSSIKKVIFTSLLFQIIVLLSEYLCSFLYRLVSSGISLKIDEQQYLYTMNFLSKIALLIIVLAISVWRNKDDEDVKHEYTVLNFVTPVFSVVLLIIMPNNETVVASNRDFFELLIIFIAMLNIINNYFLRKLSVTHKDDLHNLELKKQLEYQKEKYSQLSESYIESRRLIHDIKKHYFVIQESIKKGEYDNLLEYLDESISDLEGTYARYSTGNLVIDSLLTNYSNIAKKQGIRFEAALDIDFNRIPVSNYDFCIILGNLLDNSFNACSSLEKDDAFIHVSIYTTQNDRFIINVENSFNPNEKSKKKDDLEHGYGLKNINDTVEAYNGIMDVAKSETYSSSVMIPITNIKQRRTMPSRH